MEQRMTFVGQMLPAAIAIACLGFGLFVPACEGAASKSTSGKETTMTRLIAKKATPPIDAAAPTKTATASFALG